MEYLRKIAFWRRRPAFDAALDEEMQFHLAERADELERAGLTRKEAESQARREFGPGARLAEEARAAWQFNWLEDLLADLRHSARSLAREPGFCAVAILSLALGIGVNTAIFSLSMEALLSEPSVRSPETYAYARLGGNSHLGLKPWQFLRDLQTFPGVAGLREDGDINWRTGNSGGSGETQRLFAMRVTDNLFDEAGIPLLMGRGIRPRDQDVVVITYRMWQGKLAADPAVLGRNLTLDGRPHTIVGVLPENHRTLVGFGLSPDLYAPVRSAETEVALYLRLPEGVALGAVRERLRQAASQIDLALPERDFKYADDLQLNPVNSLSRPVAEKTVSLFFFMLMAVVSLLLGIACLNVSGLLLARSSSRTQEFAIRASLGAGRGRLMRQLLTESLLLALAGTLVGLAMNVALTRLISGFPLNNLPMPIAFRIEPDWRLLAYAATIAIGCALVVGLLPAWRASRAKAGEALKQSEHQVGGKLNLRRGLVIVQVAASIIVLTTAGLFLRNLSHAISIHPGFDLDQTLYVSMRLVPANYPDAPSREAIVRRAQTALEALPGVVSAAPTLLIPFNDDSTHGGNIHTDLSPESRRILRHVNRVGAGYFRTLGVRVIAGRELSDKGVDEVVVNQSFAERAFGTVPPVGHTVRLGDQTRTIVGVVADSKYAWLSDHHRPAVFERYAMETGGGRASIVSFMVRAGVDPESLVRPLGRQISDLDASAAVEVKPMRRAMGMALLPSQVGAGLLGLMGGLGLALTAIGLYGLVSYSVARRVREIGLRIALGAGPSRIRRLVFGEGAWLVGLGLAVGLAASYFLTRPLAQFLVESLPHTDPLTYVGASLLMLAAGALACALPTRRALRIHPMEALRYE